jgi:enamine deaminase RidA (YjgF/YER057c/UK114 family)
MKESNIHQNKTVALKYLAQDEIDTYLTQCGDRVACVVGFGSVPGAAMKQGSPTLWVETPAAGGDATYEVWTSDKPVNRYRDELIAGAGNDDVFFGCISVQFNSAKDLSEITQFSYSAIFDFLKRGSYPHLLRVWNYFSDINAIEAGIERYRSFSVGRHEAFVRYNRKVDDSPSACAVGSHGGPLVIYFLASRFPGTQIENPRQTSAYNYPRQYGPRSPTFSRATLAFNGSSQTLFVSGTASILGHATVHPDSVSLQTRETLANILAVIEQAKLQGFKFAGFENGIALKVYVRHKEDWNVVQDIVREEWGVLQQVVVLQADICRTDLLLEIEAVCWG